MIKITKGNIWDEPSAHIIVPVNCVGVMGAGLAKQCVQRHPGILSRYQLACMSKKIMPGHPLLIDRFVMFPTKDHWKDPSQLIWIEDGLRRIHKLGGIQSLSVPRIGCGLGGLDWEHQVKPLCLSILGDLPIDVTIYE